MRTRNTANDPNSAALVDAALGGDRVAMEALLALYESDIKRYARRTCRDPDDAQEAAQEAMIRLFLNIAGLRAKNAISGWLFRVVTRICFALAQRTIHLPIDVAILLRGEDAFESSAVSRLDFEAALNSLPATYQTVLLMRDVCDMGIREISGHLGITTEATKGRLHRARYLMREYLSE